MEHSIVSYFIFLFCKMIPSYNWRVHHIYICKMALNHYMEEVVQLQNIINTLFYLFSINIVILITKDSQKATKIDDKERLQHYIIDKHLSSLKITVVWKRLLILAIC